MFEIGLTGRKEQGIGKVFGQSGTGTWDPWQQIESK
jgi:hypothetical protein